MPLVITLHPIYALARNVVQFVVPLGIELPQWEEISRRIIADFGKPCGEVSALLSLPFGSKHWAVIDVQSRGDGTLGFRFLIVTKTDWMAGVDPFVLNETYPPNWNIRGHADAIQQELNFTRPTVEQAATWLKEHDRATLLGGIQAVLDGAKLWHEAGPTSATYVRAIWNLLPYRSRYDFSFATQIFQPIPELKYQALPKDSLPETLLPGLLTVQQTGDYPLGRYEQNLQLAIEERNASEFEMLLHRRTSRDTLRLALGLLLAMIAGLVVVKLLK